MPDLPTFYIPHGGGPCFFMTWPPPLAHTWDSLAAFLRGLRETIDTQPRAIVVISAHWEESLPTVTAAARPPLIFDYYGFPPETYELTYDAPGTPGVAARILELLGAAAIDARADATRGFDHGVFIPFKLIEPEAAIPIVQLSLVAGLDPERHLAIGRALAPLRDEGVLIVGSGMSYHNMREFMSASPAANGGDSFDTWLGDVAEAEPARRDERLRSWQLAPGARLAHPREEHLIPLMVAAGAAQAERGTRVFHDVISGAPIAGFRFG
jgi:aromatic ring-opening dioxygenase catalytic subunit (LigB family)